MVVFLWVFGLIELIVGGGGDGGVFRMFVNMKLLCVIGDVIVLLVVVFRMVVWVNMLFCGLFLGRVILWKCCFVMFGM